ncbi:phage portal protein [Actinomadura sp. KC345]|uniref:phage portal protein n=1 Tax=Actinomadura sp. KC345 TaxID=2530371 RepID=UPI00104A3E86|nr:phage portal protein [Actinomadura sp. KC345]TDC47648.1 phage portal protein [Actinomadura sp. KC345]
MRSPVGALLTAVTNKAPVPFTAARPGRPLNLPLFGPSSAEQQLRAMGSVGTLFSVVSRLANATSQSEWKLYRKAESGDHADRVQVTRHLALNVWDKPNPFMTRQEFVETFEQHLELTGESEWLVSRDRRASFPLELWPVRPDRIAPVPHPEKFLSGWVYASPDGQQIPLELHEVIQLRMPNPLDPYRGMGPVQTLLADLDATRYSAEWNRAFFLNSAEPGGIIEVPEALDDREFNQLRTRWNEQHQGVANAHRVAILEHGKWVDRKFTQRDMQFAELRGVSREIIREAFGVHKHMLGGSDDVNRANAEAASADFARWLIVPRLERIKQALNNDFLPMFGSAGECVEFDYCDPTPPDREADDRERESKAQAARDLIEAGAYGPDVLKALDLPDIPFGQPGADPDRELLIDLVKGAPTLAPLILPMLGYELPEEGLAALNGSQAPAPAPGDQDEDPQDPPAPPGLDNAMRWVAVCENDDDSCQPCKDNDGHLYRNRADAYADYPGGQGYVNCKGRENCRCRVVKRRKGNA